MLTVRNARPEDQWDVAPLLQAEDLLVPEPGSFATDVPAVVAEWHGQIAGAVEFDLDCDFGREEGRCGHPGPQAWVLAIAVDAVLRRRGVGRALLEQVARRADLAGRTFLALVPQDGNPEQTAVRLAFFRNCGLALIEPDVPGAAWGCPVSVLASPAVAGQRESDRGIRR
jgi:GNAT superfamily N-acetyltransferase